jgi:hypothetical protein
MLPRARDAHYYKGNNIRNCLNKKGGCTVVHPPWTYCNGKVLLNQNFIFDEVFPVRNREQTSLTTGLSHSPLT